MKTILRTLRQDLQRAVDALAMAHHGEMLCRSTKYRIIAGCSPWKNETVAKTAQQESLTLERVPAAGSD
ncbi:MAG: hypothetical protein RQ736_14150 [Thiogranum sp.]|nr:hypothetical protein [Thiogranum sp.]